jgi:hypothetical protein
MSLFIPSTKKVGGFTPPTENSLEEEAKGINALCL